MLLPGMLLAPPLIAFLFESELFEEVKNIRTLPDQKAQNEEHGHMGRCLHKAHKARTSVVTWAIRAADRFLAPSADVTEAIARVKRRESMREPLEQLAAHSSAAGHVDSPSDHLLSGAASTLPLVPPPSQPAIGENPLHLSAAEAASTSGVVVADNLMC